MQKRFRQCVLHIGTEKTGSSTIQTFLSHNRKALLKDRVIYLDTGMVGSQWEFVALAHPEPWIMDVGQSLNISNKEDQKKFKQQFLETFKTRISLDTNASSLVISSEHFHSRLNTEQMVADLKALLDPFVETFKVLIYFRRQDELAVSHLTTRIKSGFPGSEVFVPKSARASTYYDYESLVARWVNVFGLSSVVGGRYSQVFRDSHGILNDFCEKANIKLAGKKIPLWQNRSVSAGGLKFIQSLNSLYRGQKGVLSEKDRTDLINLCSLQNPGKFYPLSKAAAIDLYSMYKPGNAEVRKRLFPNLDMPLFSQDFSQYPEVPETLPTTYDAAVIQAVKLWKIEKKPTRFLSRVREIKNYVLRR